MSRSRLVGWALVLLGGCVVSGCAVPAVPASPAEAAVIQAQADRIYAEIYGDAAQRDASAYLMDLELNAPFAQCMADAGFDWSLSFDSQWSGWAPDGTSSVWLGPLQRKVSPAILGRAQGVASGEESPAEGSVQASEAYRKAQSTCRGTVHASSAELDAVGTPQGASELLSAYHGVLDQVDRTFGPTDSYDQCMKDRDVDYTAVIVDGQGASGIMEYLSSTAPKAPLPGEQPSQKWKAFLVEEQRVLDADEACRADTYYRGMALLAPHLAEFESTHATELQRLSSEWAKLLDRARSLGLPK